MSCCHVCSRLFHPENWSLSHAWGCSQAARALLCDLLLAALPDSRPALLALAAAAACWLPAVLPLLGPPQGAGACALQLVVSAAARDLLLDASAAPGARACLSAGAGSCVRMLHAQILPLHSHQSRCRLHAGFRMLRQAPPGQRCGGCLWHVNCQAQGCARRVPSGRTAWCRQPRDGPLLVSVHSWRGYKTSGGSCPL